MTKFNGFLFFINVVLMLILPYANTNGIMVVGLGLGFTLCILNKDEIFSIKIMMGLWALYSLWYLLSSIWSINPEIVYRGFRKENIYSFVAMILGYISFSHCSERIRDKFTLTVLFSGLMLALLQWADSLSIGSDSIEVIVERLLPGVGDASTFFVMFFSLSFYFFISGYKCNKYRVIIGILYQAIVFYAAYLTENRMAFVSFALIYTFFIIIVALRLTLVKRLCLFTVLVPVACSLFFMGISLKANQHQNFIQQLETVSQNDERIFIWNYYLDKASDSPILGYGAGYSMPRDTFKDDFPNGFYNLIKIHAHNVFLNKQLQMGVVGLALFLFLYGYAFKSSVFPYRRDDLSLIAVLVFVGYFSKSLTDDFFIRNSLIMFWFLVGFFIASKRDKIESESH